MTLLVLSYLRRYVHVHTICTLLLQTVLITVVLSVQTVMRFGDPLLGKTPCTLSSFGSDVSPGMIKLTLPYVSNA